MDIKERKLEDLSRKGRCYLLKQFMAHIDDMAPWDRPDEDDLFREYERMITSDRYNIGYFCEEDGPDLSELETDEEMWRYQTYNLKVKVVSWYEVPVRAKSREFAISHALDDPHILDDKVPYFTDYDFDPELEEC